MEKLSSIRKSKYYIFKFNEEQFGIKLPYNATIKDKLTIIKKLVNCQYQSVMLIWNGSELDQNLPISHYQIGESDEITIIAKDNVKKVENSKVKVSVSINSEKIDFIEDVNELFGTIIKKISETKKIDAEDYYLKFNNIILNYNQNLKFIVKPGCHQYNLVLSKKYQGIIIINYLDQKEMNEMVIKNVHPSLTVVALKEKCNQELRKVNSKLFSENCMLKEEFYVENYLTQNKKENEFYLIGDDEIFIKIKKIANDSSVLCVIMKKDNKVKMISKYLEKYFHLEGKKFGLFKNLELKPDLTWEENNILTLDEIIIKQKYAIIECLSSNVDTRFVIWKEKNPINANCVIDIDETIAKLKQIHWPVFQIPEERQMWYVQNKQLVNEQTLSSQLTNQNTFNNLIKITIKDSEARLIKKVTFFITLDNVDNVESKVLNIDLGEKVIDLKEKYKDKIGLPTERQSWELKTEKKELLDTIMLFLQCEESKFNYINVFKKHIVRQILFEIYKKSGKNEVTLDVNLEHEISKLKRELDNIIGICAENQIWSYLGQMLNDHNNLLIVMENMDPKILIRDSALPDPIKLKILWFQPNLRLKAKPKQYEIEISKKVLELKGDLESEFNLEAKRQVWVYEDLELKDGITFEAQVKGDYEHPVKVTEIPIMKTIILEQKSRKPKNIEFTADIHQTILALKSNVNSLLKIPIDNQIWFWKKDELKDDELLSSQVEEENGVYKLLLKVKAQIIVENNECSLPIIIKPINYPISDLLDLVAQNCKRQPSEIELIYKNNKVNEELTLDELDDCDRFVFTLEVNIILRICSGKEFKEIKVKKSTTIGTLRNLISELFALSDSNFKLYSGNTLLDDE